MLPFIDDIEQVRVNGRGRPTKFTPERIQQIKNLVERGSSHDDIAVMVGCTVGTLKVMCSKLGVSLRRPRFDLGTGVLTQKPKKCEAQPVEKPLVVEEPPVASPRRVPVSFTFSMSYKGRDIPVNVPISEEQLGQLALEAEIRGMRLGELVGAVLVSVCNRDMFDTVLGKNGQ